MNESKAVFTLVVGLALASLITFAGCGDATDYATNDDLLTKQDPDPNVNSKKRVYFRTLNADSFSKLEYALTDKKLSAGVGWRSMEIEDKSGDVKAIAFLTDGSLSDKASARDWFREKLGSGSYCTSNAYPVYGTKAAGGFYYAFRGTLKFSVLDS